MPLDPGRLTTDLIEDYGSYLRSRFHFRDERLRQQFAHLLDTERRLHAGPYLELMPAFETGASLRQLVDRGLLHRQFLELDPAVAHFERPLYHHQQEAIEKIQRGRNVIVATGTGSGKTEAYLLPILSELFAGLQAPGRRPRVRALLVYPMNALANDQLRRIRELLARTPGVTFGRYTGETPRDPDEGVKRFRQMWPHEPILRNELKSRSEMWQTPPDILITNFAMLEYLLVRPQDSVFFDPGAYETLRFLVFDEVHTYDGAKGTEIAMLLRRLKQRVGLTERGRLRCIGTSATLGGGRDLPDVAKFAELLFDEPFEWGAADGQRDVVQAARVPYVVPQRLWTPSADAYERLLALTTRASVGSSDVKQAVEGSSIPGDIVDSALKRLAPEGPLAATGPVASSGGEADDWGWSPPSAGAPVDAPLAQTALREAIHTLLEGDERLVRLNRACLQGARPLMELNGEVFTEPDERLSRERALLSLISVAGRAISPSTGAPLVRGRYHFFLRALEGGFVCFGNHGDSGPRLHLERRTTCSIHGDHKTFEIGVCRRCGETIIAGSLERDPETHRDIVGTEDPTQDTLLDEPERRQRVFLALRAPASAEPDEDEIDDDATQAVGEVKKVRFCARCGVLAEEGTDDFCDCGPLARAVDAFRLATREGDVKMCPSCGARSLRREVLQRLYTGPDEPVAEIATTVFQSANADYLHGRAEKQKLLTFSDSRQDAAFFAPYLQSLYKTALRRHVILQLLDGVSAPMAVGDLASRLALEIEKQGWLGPSATTDEIKKESWRWTLGELLHTTKDRRSLEELGLLRFSLRRFSDVKAPPPLLKAPWHLDEHEAWTLVETLLNSLRDLFVLTSPAGLRPDDEVYLPGRGDGAVALKRVAGDVSTRAWVPQLAHLSNSRLDYLDRLVRRRGIAITREQVRQFLADFFERYVTAPQGLFVSRYLDVDASDPSRGVVYQLATRGWEATPAPLAGTLHRCTRCGARTFHSLSGVCPTYRCDGELQPESAGAMSDRSDHYRRRYRGMGSLWMVAREHTAQLDSNTASGFQNLFYEGKIDVLSCSTTFELGVDLGELETVLMRNVPPTPANYAQRSGRAGRRLGSAAFVVTYAQRRSHDLTYYNEPLRMIAGRVRPPFFRLENERIVRRHLYASALADFFRQCPDAFGTGKAKDLFGGDNGDGRRTPALVEFLESHPQPLGSALSYVVPAALQDGLGVGSWGWVPEFLRLGVTSIESVEAEYQRDCDHYLKAEQEASLAGQHRKAGLLQWIRKTVQSRHLLGVLANRGLFPKYGFPVDVVGLEVAPLAVKQVTRTGEGHHLDSFGLELQRDLRLAIAEYAPGSEVVAAGYVWRSVGLKVFPDRRLEEKNYYACPCGAFQLVPPSGAPGACPHCGEASKNARTGRFIKPEFGFVTTTDAPKASTTRRPSRQHATRLAFADYLGTATPEFVDRWPGIRVGEPRQARLISINTGFARRGFRVCQSCGAADVIPHGGLKFTNSHKSPRGTECSGTYSFGVDLGHEYITDVLELRLSTSLPMKKPDWWAVGYALAEGASTTLGIRRDDLDVTVRVSPDGGFSVFLTDAVPGGAGHVTRVHQHLALVAGSALDRVANCHCEETTSCYECLRTFSNQRLHGQLSRGAAARFLEAALAERQQPHVTSPAGAGSDVDALSLIGDDALRAAMVEQVARGLPVPEVGFEVIDAVGAVVAELEVAWPSRRVGVVLTGENGVPGDGWILLRAEDVVRSPDTIVAALGAPTARHSPPRDIP